MSDLLQAVMRNQEEYRRSDIRTLPLPDGLPTAQDTFTDFVGERLAPMLRELGFKGSRQKYNFDAGPYRGRLDLQKSRYSTKTIVEFTFNVGATHRPTKTGYWRERVGHLIPAAEDTWWRLPAGADTDGLLADLAGVLRDYGLQALLAATDSPGYPPDPDRTWGRQFADPIEQFRLDPNRVGRPVFPPGASFDEALDAAVNSSDFQVRAAALDIAYKRGRDDPRLGTMLVTMLRQEPRSTVRARAARLLGFISHRPSAVDQELREAATDDEDLDVRVSAKFALRLIA